jgi:hypothetical protein
VWCSYVFIARISCYHPLLLVRMMRRWLGDRNFMKCIHVESCPCSTTSRKRSLKVWGLVLVFCTGGAPLPLVGSGYQIPKVSYILAVIFCSTWNDACSRFLFVATRRGFTQVKLFSDLIASPDLFLDMKLVFTAGFPFRSGELSDTSPSLLNWRICEDYVPWLKAAYCQAS